MQASVRTWTCRRDLSLATTNAIRIQRCYRNARMHMRHTYKLKLASYTGDSMKSHEVKWATLIQSAFRSWKCKKDLLKAHKVEMAQEPISVGEIIGSQQEDICVSSAVIIQSMIRGFLLQNMMKMSNDAARIIQCAWRRYVFSLRTKLFLPLRCRRQRSIITQYHESTDKIQVLYFSWKMKVILEAVQHSAIQVQRIIRGHLSRRRVGRVTSAIDTSKTTEGSVPQSSFSLPLDQDISPSNSKEPQLLCDATTLITKMDVDSNRNHIPSDFYDDENVNPQLTNRIHPPKDVQRIIYIQSLARCKILNSRANSYNLSAKMIQNSWRDYKLQRQNECCQKRHYHLVLEKAVVMTQRKWRRYLRHEKEAQWNIAATTIQAMIRSWSCRQVVSQMRILQADEEEKALHARMTAATTIQSLMRSYNSRKEVSARRQQVEQAERVEASAAATTVESMARMWLSKCELSHLKIRAQELDEARRYDGATMIQTQVRSWQCRRDFSQRKEQHGFAIEQAKKVSTAAATTVQSVVRSWVCQQELSRRRRQRQDELRNASSSAATKIQSIVRSWKCRQDLYVSTSYAIKIQQYYRRHAQCAIAERNYLKSTYANELWQQRKSKAATTIQTLVRSYCYRRVVLIRKEEASQARLLSRSEEEAAIRIQAIVRSWIRQRELHLLLELKKSISENNQKLLAATKIQAITRSWMIQKTLRNATANATKIQRCHRNFSSSELDLKQSYAAELWQRHENSSVTTIQACARSWNARRELVSMKDEKYAATRYLLETNAATKIESIVRSWICKKELARRKEGHLGWKIEQKRKLTAAVVKVQASVRCHIVRHGISAASTNATRIQQCYRNYRMNMRHKHVARVNTYADKLWQSHEVKNVTLVQAVVRSRQCQKYLSEMKAARHNQQLMEAANNSAATMIQSLVRGQSCRREFIERREEAHHQSQLVMSATIKIQSMVRLLICQKELRMLLELKESINENNRKLLAATKIQSIVRSMKCQGDFINIRVKARQAQQQLLAVIKIQSLVRSHSCRKELNVRREKAHQARVLLATVKIQSFLRSCQHGEKFLSISYQADFFIKSAVVIQSIVRGYILRSKLKKVNDAARSIQHAWRRCVISLQMKLLQVFELASNQHTATHGIYSIPSPMKKARALLPRHPESLNRIRDITPQLPRQYECGIFVEEIVNSVAVVIQSAARQYLAKKKFHLLNQAHSTELVFHQAQSENICVLRDTSNNDEGAKVEECKQIISMKSSTEDENKLILRYIYQPAHANTDATSIYSGKLSTSCVSYYAKKFIHATEQDNQIDGKYKVLN